MYIFRLIFEIQIANICILQDELLALQIKQYKNKKKQKNCNKCMHKYFRQISNIFYIKVKLFMLRISFDQIIYNLRTYVLCITFHIFFRRSIFETIFYFLFVLGILRE